MAKQHPKKVPPEAIANMFAGLNDFMKKFGIEEIQIGSKSIKKTKGTFAKPVIKKPNDKSVSKNSRPERKRP